MRRPALVLVVLALLAACNGGEGAPQPTPTPNPHATPPPTPTPTPTPTPEPAVAPLTGLEVDDDAVLERPPLAVKIDNHPQAQPQDGIEDADLVFAELVEYGLTRFLAFFHSTDPGEVGPVRSAREVDLELTPVFEPVFAYSGAAQEVVDALGDTGMVVTTEDDPGWMRRQRSTPREHTLYAEAATLWELGADLPPAEQPWPFDEAQPEGGEPVAGMALTYSSATTVTWEWDGERFVRSQFGRPHVTEADARVGAETVVVPRVAVHPGPRGGGTVVMDVVGEGDALVFRGGEVFEGRWRRDSEDVHFEWLTADGDPLPLAPGQTWVELVPLDGAVEVEPAEGG